VVVDNLYVFRTPGFPHEADAELIVDPKRPLPFAVSMQRMKPVTGRRAQILEGESGIQPGQPLRVAETTPSAKPFGFLPSKMASATLPFQLWITGNPSQNV
jgi:hypothetical protein